MLNIINNLYPFFEDCYRRISVREYAKIIKVSPPTASSMLHSLERENILLKEKDRNYLFFHANKENRQFIDLSRMYWSYKLNKLVSYVNDKSITSAIILFGSLSKAEVKEDSDIDLAIIGDKKEIDLKEFEKKLKREIQIFRFNSIEEIKPRELKNNILNGSILSGRLK